jgi:CRISPR-associated protein Csm3
VYEGDSKELIKGVFQSMLLLEDNYLGGSGSRGFGKVKFENITVEKRDASYYKEVKEADKIIENGTIAEAIAVLQ